MMHSVTSKSALGARPLGGRRAVVFTIAMIAIPSLIRLLLIQVVSTDVFLTYVPFVLLAAVMLTARDAALVAATCAIVADFFFMEPGFALAIAPNDLFSMGMLLIVSALSIFLVGIVRQRVTSHDEPSGSVIFSEKGGEAWVNWHGRKPPVKLGPHKDVAEMMEDYIAQVELGERLNAKK